MGTGGRNNDQAEQDRLAREREAQNVATNAAIARAEAPSELEKFLGDEDLEILKYFSGKGGEPIDVRRGPGMQTANALYDDAIKDRGEERMGIGALRMGGNEDAGYTNLIKENMRDRNQQAAAGRLEGAVGQRIASARGEAMPLINISNERDMGIAGLRSGAYENAADRDQRFRMRPKQESFWKSLARTGVQAKVMMACVVNNTPILTPLGYVPIEDLQEGDLVIGVNINGERLSLPIVRKRQKAGCEVLRITNSENESVECTPSDRILLTLDDRSETTTSELYSGQKVAGTSIKTIEPVKERKTVTIIKLGNTHENFGFISNAFTHLDDYFVKGAHG